MRLICPNCNAQYQVDDSVIPDDGRDVQCSNCGNTWFQESAKAQKMAATAEPSPEQKPQEQEPVEAEPDLESFDEQDTGFDETETWDDDDFDDETEVEPTPAPQPESAPRSSVDESIAGILREEAEREAAARKAASERLGGPLNQTVEPAFPEPDIEDSFETETADDIDGEFETETTAENVVFEQESEPSIEEPDVEEPETENLQDETETGDTDTDDSQVTAQVHNYVEDETETDDDVPVVGRADLLPDIEEINSTLSDSQDDDEDDYEDDYADPEPRRRGFRRGYVLTLLIFAIMALAYAYAPKIVEVSPESEPYMYAYVEWVNDFRDTVDAFMALAAEKLTDLAGRISK